MVPDRKPNAMPNDIVVTTTARTTRVNSRRVMMAGFRRVTCGSMVPIPARHVGRGFRWLPRSCLVYRCDGTNLGYEHCASLAVGNAGSGRLEGGLMLC